MILNKSKILSNLLPIVLLSSAFTFAENTFAVPPDPTHVTILTSNHDDFHIGVIGNLVIVQITKLSPGSTLSGTIGGQSADGHVFKPSAILVRFLDGTETEGTLDFEFTETDAEGNDGNTITTTTDGTFVTTYFTPPPNPDKVIISSSNADPTLATIGDTVTISFDVKLGSSVSGTIGGKEATGDVTGTTATLFRTFDGTETEGTLDFEFTETDAIGVDGNTISIIIVDDEISGINIETISIIVIVSIIVTSADESTSSKGGCNDCTPPTLGYDSMGVKKVDNGVCINDSCMDGGYFHTEYPMQATVLNFSNTMSLKYYENNGPSNIKLVQLGMGVAEIGSPLSESQAVIEVWLNPFKHDMYNPTIQEIKIIDPDEILAYSTATVQLVQCMDDSNNPLDCLQTNFSFSYAKPPRSPILVTNAWDVQRNTINNYINNGLNVIYYTPEISDPPEIESKQCHTSNAPTRNNPCQFLLLVNAEIQRAQDYLDQFK